MNGSFTPNRDYAEAERRRAAVMDGVQRGLAEAEAANPASASAMDLEPDSRSISSSSTPASPIVGTDGSALCVQCGNPHTRKRSNAQSHISILMYSNPLRVQQANAKSGAVCKRRA